MLSNLHFLFPHLYFCRAGASRLSTTDCASQKQRRWPEDLAWHPEGNSLFSVYSADGGDSQVSITNLNKGQGVRFLTQISWHKKKLCLGFFYFLLVLMYANYLYVIGRENV